MLNKIINWWKNWNDNYKKLVMSIGFLLAVTVIAYTIYKVFFTSPQAPQTTNLPTSINFGTLPTSGTGRNQSAEETKEELPLPTLEESELKPDLVASGGKTLANPKIYSNAQNAVINKNGNINYYNAISGQFYTVGQDGKKKALSEKKFPNVQNVTWAPKNDTAILEFPDGSNIYYDFETNKQYTLPKEGQDFQFSDSGTKIVYEFITDNEEENWLITSNPTGENTVAVEHIGNSNPRDIITKWSPDNTKLAFYRSSSGLDSEEVLMIGQNQENFKSLKVKGRGFNGIWSPEGDKILYNIHSAESGYRPELWITDARDDNLGVRNKNLGIRTWVDKCTFASDNATAYCAVPLYLKQGTGLYPELANTVPDTIYKINIKTGFKQQIAIPTNSLGISLYTADKLTLSSDGSILYMNDKNGGVYEIRLK